MGVMKGDSRSVDYGSYGRFCPLEIRMSTANT